jgi:hypothetical protein
LQKIEVFRRRKSYVPIVNRYNESILESML